MLVYTDNILLDVVDKWTFLEGLFDSMYPEVQAANGSEVCASVALTGQRIGPLIYFHMTSSVFDFFFMPA